MIEPDLSNAAPFLALPRCRAARSPSATGPSATTQAGDALREILTRDGLRASSARRTASPSTAATGLHGVDLDLHDVGELAPAVAALCALADSPSHLRGIAHIRGHETDRLAALATELGRLGADVTEHDDGLSFRPAPLHGGVFHTYADHRMAHAGVILGAAVDGVLVENVGTTAKTFTDFAPFWAGLLDRRRMHWPMSGRYSEHDQEHYERPRRHTRPRTKERPTYDDAVDGVVLTVDRGRFTLRVDGPHRDGDEVAAPRTQGRRRR